MTSVAFIFPRDWRWSFLCTSSTTIPRPGPTLRSSIPRDSEVPRRTLVTRTSLCRLEQVRGLASEWGLPWWRSRLLWFNVCWSTSLCHHPRRRFPWKFLQVPRLHLEMESTCESSEFRYVSWLWSFLASILFDFDQPALFVMNIRNACSKFLPDINKGSWL